MSRISIPCIAGIDGGGTYSRMLLTDLQMNLLCETNAGTTNLCAADKITVKACLFLLFKQAEEALNANLAVKAVALGTAGVTKKNAIPQLTDMLKDITGCSHVTVTGDMVLPLYAFAPEGNAQNIIAGTGSVCYGKNEAGETWRSGGWGHIWGDEGGAYWMACRALDACLRAYDGRGQKTRLTAVIQKHFKVSSPEKIVSALYNQPFEKSKIAKIAVYVSKAAEENDEVALSILNKAADELFLLSKGVSDRLGKPDTVLFTGSVLLKNKRLQSLLQQKIQDSYHNVSVAVMDSAGGSDLTRDAAWGAVQLAAACLPRKR